MLFKRAIVLFVCVLIVGSTALLASPKTSVRVGVYNFPPIAMVDQNNKAKGFLGELLKEFRGLNENLSFQIVHTSPSRRHLDFRNVLFDVIFFENPNWGWKSEAVNISSALLRDDEVYIALKKEGRNQSFFDTPAKKRIVAIAGYHYGFAKLETDSSKLRQQFDIELSHSHQRNLELIRADRPSVAEVAIVSRSFLEAYFVRFPDRRSEFLVSDALDQSYELSVITRKEGTFDTSLIDRLMQPLIENGRYQALVHSHGLQLPDRLARRR